MFLAKFKDQLYTVDEFRRHVGADYYERGIFPYCPDCEAKVTLRADAALPYDVASLFPDAAKIVTAHFSHFPGQGDPDCRYRNERLDLNAIALTSGVERIENNRTLARRQFVTEDGRVTQAGYWAGFLMARMIGHDRLRGDYQFFSDAQHMLTTKLIPEAHSKLWQRGAPGWARPFTWLLFHVFPMKGQKKDYEIQFKLDLPEGSIMDATGVWHGEPAALVKAFKDSGKLFTDREGQPIRYLVTEENAYQLAKQAAHWQEGRPFPQVPLHKLHAHALFPKAAVDD